MANNLVQIKRSNTTATPGNALNPGELAFSYNGNSMFIGAQTGIGSAATKIAGWKYGYVDNIVTAGALAANAVHVTDSNSFISNLYSSGLFLAPTILSPVANSTAALITSISPQANSTQLGASPTGSNTELATTSAIYTFVIAKTSTFANIAANNVTISGNLTVSGTMTTLNTTNIQIADNFIQLADNNQNQTTDVVDIGIFGQANSGGVTTYYGLGRVAAANAFQLFSTTTSPGATTIGADTTMPLQAFLQPWGNSGAFVVNSTTFSVTANSTVSVTLTANTIALSTALYANSGGTGQSSYAIGDILYASASGTLTKLSVGANGSILQIINNIPSYGSIDGGTY